MTSTVNPLQPLVQSDGLTGGKLEFKRNSTRITIDAATDLEALYETRFEGPAATVREQERTVTIEYPLISPAGWVHLVRRAAAVTLAAELPWEIGFRGGVHRLGIDLTSGILRSLEITGGVSQAQLYLPAPRGIVPLRIGGGARKLTVIRPTAAPVRLRVGGGAQRLVLDHQHYGAIGGEIRLDALGAGEAADRYELEIAGGASHLTVTTLEPVSRS